jgi:hypothetical protein
MPVGSIVKGIMGSGAAAGASGAASSAGWDAYNKSLLTAGSNKAISSPYLSAGYAATNALLRSLGLGHLNPMNTDGGVTSTAYGETSLNTSDVAGDRRNALTDFQASPGYQWRVDQGTKALDRSAAAKGMVLSGAQKQAVSDYGQNTASDEWGKYINQLMGMSGLGADAAKYTNNANTSAFNMGINALTTGQLDAAKYGMASGNALADGFGNAINSLGSIVGYGIGNGWFSGGGNASTAAGGAGIGRAAGGIRPASV